MNDYLLFGLWVIGDRMRDDRDPVRNRRMERSQQVTIYDIDGRDIEVFKVGTKQGDTQIHVHKNGRKVLRLDDANATRLAGHLEGNNPVTLEDVVGSQIWVNCAMRWVFIYKNKRSILMLRMGPAKELGTQIWDSLGVVHSSNE